MTTPEFDAESFVALAFKTKDGFGETVEFVRTDLHDATKVQLAECEARLRKAMGALRLADDALTEAEAILGGEYGDMYGPLCETMLELRDVLAEIKKGGV